MHQQLFHAMLLSTPTKAVLCAALLLGQTCYAVSPQVENEVFSGPQVGEALPPLPVTLPLDESSESNIDAAATDAKHPHRLIVFVHQITRPSIAFTRTLGEYAATREADGLATCVVFLGSDATELAGTVRRARHALPTKVKIGISSDGMEGPGAYGLNREVTLTVLLASEGKVKFNAALIDPSIPVELPKVLQAICDAVGGQPPKVESLMGRPAQETTMVPNEQVPGFSKIEPLVRMLIRKETSDQRVDELAKQIDDLLKDAPEAKQRLKEIAGRVYNIYGTDQAKTHLRRWAGVVEEKNDADKPTEPNQNR